MSCFVRTMLAGGRKANARVALCWVRSVWNRFPAFTWSLVAVEASKPVQMPCRPGAASAAVVHVHAPPLREREVAGGIEIRVVARRERESPSLAPEAVEAGRPELVGERGPAGDPVVARRKGAPIRDVQVGEAAEQLPEGRAVTEQLAAQSRRIQAKGEVEPTLVAERRRQMEAAGGVPHVAHRRPPVGVAGEAEG